jgi:hypothetical protein
LWAEPDYLKNSDDLPDPMPCTPSHRRRPGSSEIGQAVPVPPRNRWPRGASPLKTIARRPQNAPKLQPIRRNTATTTTGVLDTVEWSGVSAPGRPTRRRPSEASPRTAWRVGSVTVGGAAARDEGPGHASCVTPRAASLSSPPAKALRPAPPHVRARGSTRVPSGDSAAHPVGARSKSNPPRPGVQRARPGRGTTPPSSGSVPSLSGKDVSYSMLLLAE